MDAAPGPEPEPSDDLAERQLPLRTFDEPIWYRGHTRKNPPLHFNRENGRFCTPEGTLYLGTDPKDAFLEAFAQYLGSDPRRYIVSQGLLDRSCLCVVTARRPFRLVDLTAGHLLRRWSAMADARISVGTHAMSQRWARALWSHPDRPDGILYPCRRASELQSIALFARVQPDLIAECHPDLPRDPGQLVAILDHYACALVP